MGRIIAIDYGRKKIGLAVTDESKIVISNLPQIPNNPDLWKNLVDLLDNYKPEIILLGFPGSHLNELSNVQKEILNFQKKLESMSNITVILRDESYTSEEASKIFVEQRGGKNTSAKKFKERKQKIDSLAAHLLIKSYLNFL